MAHKNQPTETFTAVSGSGRVILRQQGIPDKVRVKAKDALKMRLRAMLNMRPFITHNHNEFFTDLTLPDIISAIKLRARQMRATSISNKVPLIELPERFSGRAKKNALKFLYKHFGLTPPRTSDIVFNPKRYIEDNQKLTRAMLIKPTPEDRKVIEKAIPGIKFRTTLIGSI